MKYLIILFLSFSFNGCFLLLMPARYNFIHLEESIPMVVTSPNIQIFYLNHDNTKGKKLNDYICNSGDRISIIGYNQKFYLLKINGDLYITAKVFLESPCYSELKNQPLQFNIHKSQNNICWARAYDYLESNSCTGEFKIDENQLEVPHPGGKMPCPLFIIKRKAEGDSIRFTIDCEVIKKEKFYKRKQDLEAEITPIARECAFFIKNGYICRMDFMFD